MAVFQRSLHGEDPTFANLFRMLDDFGTYSREVQGSRGNNTPKHLFSPKFDVCETDNTYELDVELPGINRENLQIEFTEPQSLTVRGRIERNYTSGTPPSAEDNQTGGATAEGADAGHKATAAEEDKDTKENGETTGDIPQQKKGEVANRHGRYWHQERSIGEFHRSFYFPTRIDESAVKASLDNGVLRITVPKAAKHETRRISIN